MHSKNTQRLIESRPQRLKTAHKYPRSLITLLQQTTNQIIPLAFTLETHQNHSPLLYTYSRAQMYHAVTYASVDSVMKYQTETQGEMRCHMQ